jgi:hypothetical protein
MRQRREAWQLYILASYASAYVEFGVCRVVGGETRFPDYPPLRPNKAGKMIKKLQVFYLPIFFVFLACTLNLMQLQSADLFLCSKRSNLALGLLLLLPANSFICTVLL